MVRELNDEAREYLDSLDVRITPKGMLQSKSLMVKLTPEEVEQVFGLVDEYSLVCELCGSYSMFGGVGIALYAHEQQLGTGAELLCVITEDNLPPPPASYAKKIPGGVDPYAWDLFNRYAQRPKNVEWLKHYKLKPNKERYSYEY